MTNQIKENPGEETEEENNRGAYSKNRVLKR